MPYIKSNNREKYQAIIDGLVDIFSSQENPCGDINYVVSSIVYKLFEQKKSYATANNLMGVLECIKQEFYRRKVSPYEDVKIKENGDVLISDEKYVNDFMDAVSKLNP